MTDAVIFDIDGTLANINHRLHTLVSDGPKKDWHKFFELCKDDIPNEDIRELFWYIEASRGDTGRPELLVVSGRPDNIRALTENWLKENGIFPKELHMRRADDFRADHVVKEEILRELQKRYTIRLVIDDRQSVVDMWRRNGITCLQCAPGDNKPLIQKDQRLYLMVGPSGAGKTTYAADQILSKSLGFMDYHCSDDIRWELLGTIEDQTKNDLVFSVLHHRVRSSLMTGRSVIYDATNLRNKDRKSAANLCPEGVPCTYVVVNRPLADKLRDRDWRSEELVRRHDQIFKSNLKDILVGDGLPHVTVDNRNF